VVDSDCPKCGAFCSGGSCYGGSYCSPPTNSCSAGICVQCVNDSTCRSDSNCGAYCNSQGLCQSSSLNCLLNSSQSHCKITTGQCVQCLSNNHCSYPNPYCGSDNNCKPCLLDSHCRNVTNCNANCTNSTCTSVPPVLNCNTIDNTFKCDVGRAQCLQCLSDSDCTNISESPYCYTQFGTCNPCAISDQCRSDQNCNSVCAEVLLGNTTYCTDSHLDCTTNPQLPYCSRTLGTCCECRSDSNCAQSLEQCYFADIGQDSGICKFNSGRAWWLWTLIVFAVALSIAIGCYLKIKICSFSKF